MTDLHGAKSIEFRECMGPDTAGSLEQENHLLLQEYASQNKRTVRLTSETDPRAFCSATHGIDNCDASYRELTFSMTDSMNRACSLTCIFGIHLPNSPSVFDGNKTANAIAPRVSTTAEIEELV